MTATTYIQDINIRITADLNTITALRQHIVNDINVMVKSDVFTFGEGQATLARDNTGKLRKIRIDKVKYKG